MRKQKLLLFAVMCAIVFTGCKKKETVDLSSLHTTAAIEKETMPATAKAEPTAAPSEPADADNKNTDSKYSVKTAIKSYTNKAISVEYPEISGMKDAEKQKQANDVLKRNAEAIADVYPAEGDGQSLVVKATVESVNLRRITVTYKGEYKESASKTMPIFYTNTVNLETAHNLGLSDFTDAYTVAGYIASGDYKLESVSASSEQAVRAYLNTADKTTDYYYKLLSASDFSGGQTDGAAKNYTAQTWPQVFSYEKQGIMYVSVPVSQELGSYVIVRYSPDNK